MPCGEAVPQEMLEPPDVGLYQYTGNDTWEKFTPRPLKAGQKVLLFVHGWKPGGSGVMDRFVTPAEQYGEAVDTLQPWEKAGYLVLSFQWHQYADEPVFLQVEQKIWDAAATGRWRVPQGPYIVSAPRERSMGAEFFEAYRQAFSNTQGLYIHLAGHSLGCQMASCLLGLLMEMQTSPLPNRVTFLDPYFSNFGKGYLGGRWTGAVVREVISRLIKEFRVPVEQYKSSAVLDNPISDSNAELRRMTAYFVLKPYFLGMAWGARDTEVLKDRHSAGRFLYFWSKAHPAAPEVAAGWAQICGGPSPTGELAGYANTPDARLMQMMAKDHFWVQSSGLRDPNPGRHAFLRRRAAAGRPFGELPLEEQPGGAAEDGGEPVGDAWVASPA
eukprot:EG_transcript_11003